MSQSSLKILYQWHKKWDSNTALCRYALPFST